MSRPSRLAGAQQTPVVDSLNVAGEWPAAARGATFEVHDPANGTVISRVSDGGAEHARAAVEAAQAAAADRSSRTAYDRSAFLYAAHQLMLERSEDLAKLMTTPAGQGAAGGAHRGEATPPTS